MNRVAITIVLLGIAAATPGADSPIIVTGPEQAQVDLTKSYGNLSPRAGVAELQVFRASRAVPELTDGRGWTYNHHVDLACWKGRLYLAWNSCEIDEDVWPSRELYSTSTDGVNWSSPAELFPQGTSTALRMYFFYASNGRMLAIGGYRSSRDNAAERDKGSLVVREIKPDHTLGEVFMLRPPNDPSRPGIPQPFEKAGDAGFVEACRELLANKPFLEQSDYGTLLGAAKMKWHDVNSWPADEPSREFFPKRFGKASAFYHRADGALVAVMKFGWVLVSHDNGETWSSPVRPPTLVSGMAKTWGQKTADGNYLLAYNPSLELRYPLVAVTGTDGITFGGMKVIHGEVPQLRYAGLYKMVGPQYVRGISEWSSDGSFPGDATWIAYSVGKEDIWISRIPPEGASTASSQATARSPDLISFLDEGWNLYSPKWAFITLQHTEGKPFLRLRDTDPADYARAWFPLTTTGSLQAVFDIRTDGAGEFQIELYDRPAGPVGGVALTTSSKVQTREGNTLPYRAGEWMRFTFDVDSLKRRYSISVNDRTLQHDAAFAPDAAGVNFLCFTTGTRPEKIAPDADRPVGATTLDIRGMRVVRNP